jgi:hypothetical protein
MEERNAYALKQKEKGHTLLKLIEIDGWNLCVRSLVKRAEEGGNLCFSPSVMNYVTIMFNFLSTFSLLNYKRLQEVLP